MPLEHFVIFSSIAIRSSDHHQLPEGWRQAQSRREAGIFAQQIRIFRWIYALHGSYPHP
jgi:hypothetical protein